ncbi:hypothetical protein ABBQ32_003080 [Trebouxia sp. C0010 RCD-2024]
MRARQLITKLRPAGGLALVGLLGWTTADALNEALVYRECQRLALEKATKNAELSEQLGLPLTPGPWYNASIGLTHRDNMANCQFTLLGSKHSSDIYMRVVRTKGPRSTLLYNLIGPANWEVLLMEASVSAGGGLSRNISLTDIAKPHKGEAVS